MILTLYARAPLLCVDSVCARAPPQCCARDRSVPRSNGDRLYNTVRAGVYHGACTLTVGRRRTPRDDTRTGYHHPQPTSGGLARSAGELWLGVRQRASPPERCFRVHCDHLDHGYSPRRLKLWVRGEGAVHARKRLWGEMRAAGWVIRGSVGRGEFLGLDILLIGCERLPRTRR